MPLIILSLKILFMRTYVKINFHLKNYNDLKTEKYSKLYKGKNKHNITELWLVLCDNRIIRNGVNT